MNQQAAHCRVAKLAPHEPANGEQSLRALPHLPRCLMEPAADTGSGLLADKATLALGVDNLHMFHDSRWMMRDSAVVEAKWPLLVM